MIIASRSVSLLTVVLICLPAAADPPAGSPPTTKLSLTGLAPAKIQTGLCLLKYRISTNSPDCQTFFDQGLGYFYSYVWMEASRSFETAVRKDPDCALAWWGLSRALERWGKNKQATEALLKAYELRDHASHREQQLILARMQEKGQIPGVGDSVKRHQAAIATIDAMISLYDDDQEAWMYRAQLASGGRLFGSQTAAVPFYKALLRINPLHPGANHELVHYYENVQRPALGWVYAERYIESSPGIPHPYHMQAHLATRLGRWDKTSDRSARAIELERAYHRDMNVKPKEDSQYAHHLEILTLSLIHDGRYREAHAIKDEAWKAGYRSWLTWFRLYLAERNWPEALKIVDHFRKNDKVTAAYLAALVYLKQGDTDRATPEVQVLQEAYRERKKDKTREFRLWETQGLLMCRTGNADAGLKLLAKAVAASKDSYAHHAWGNGAYYMEPWGTGALRAGKWDTAEEAFLEALAHDPGCVRAAMGLQVLCERQGRTEEAHRYAELAHKCWCRAEVRDFETELAAMRGIAAAAPVQRTQIGRAANPDKPTEQKP